MAYRGLKILNMVKEKGKKEEKYNFRKKIKINYQIDSPESQKAFSSGSSDVVEFSDHGSDPGGSENNFNPDIGLNCGFIEVSPVSPEIFSQEQFKSGGKEKSNKTDNNIINRTKRNDSFTKKNDNKENESSKLLEQTLSKRDVYEYHDSSSSGSICSDSVKSMSDVSDGFSGLRKTQSPLLNTSFISPEILPTASILLETNKTKDNILECNATKFDLQPQLSAKKNLFPENVISDNVFNYSRIATEAKQYNIAVHERTVLTPLNEHEPESSSIVNNKDIVDKYRMAYDEITVPVSEHQRETEYFEDNFNNNNNSKSYNALQNRSAENNIGSTTVFKDLNEIPDTDTDVNYPSPQNIFTCKALAKPTESANKQRPIGNVDRILNNFGKIVKDDSVSRLEVIKDHRRWTKKNCCPYCYVEVTHFPRHLQRNHNGEGAVKEIMRLSINDPKRKQLLDSLRKQGNYALCLNNEKIRPVRRPRSATSDDDHMPCSYCLGIFKKDYLRRHRKKCKMNLDSENKKRTQHQSECQAFFICSGIYKDFYDSLRLKKEVLDKMHVDDISKTVIGDVLICSYGESQLRRHKRVQLATMISNKIRELGRLLMVIKEMTGVQRFLDVLKPEFFDNIVTATKIISGYREEQKDFKAPSLALHMSTRLTQVCDVASKLIIKKSPFLKCDDPEDTLKKIKRLRSLIKTQWNSELSSLALKDLNEKQWEKPKLLPLTSELMEFQKYVMLEANNACDLIKENTDLNAQFRRLTECIMALTLLLNRKRIGEIQFLKLKSYANESLNPQQEEFLESLSSNEKLLTQSFKRILTGGKGSKPVAILFPKKIQLLIDVLLSVRSKCVPSSNEYLFANPRTENRWISGYHVLKKLADSAGVKNKDLFTSTRLRKHIATVLQVMTVTDSEMEQFANFMGHTKKTHQEYYRLPQDLFQTAKVSKILLAISQGKGAHYKGKTLDEIELSDTVDSDTDTDEEDKKKENRKLLSCKTKPKRSHVSVHTTTKDINDDVPCSSGLNKQMESSPSCASSSSEEIDLPQGRKNSNLVQRRTWTKDQKAVILTFFNKHIKKKVAPKKHEVEELRNLHKKLLKGRSWVQIKAFVYNCYRKIK